MQRLRMKWFNECDKTLSGYEAGRALTWGFIVPMELNVDIFNGTLRIPDAGGPSLLDMQVRLRLREVADTEPAAVVIRKNGEAIVTQVVPAGGDRRSFSLVAADIDCAPGDIFTCDLRVNGTVTLVSDQTAWTIQQYVP